MTTRQLALEYFAKRKTGSGGRMMPSHYSDVERHIWSVPTPTGSQLLPGCGMAWGIQLDGKRNVVVTTVGDAATRQGDFFEAVCFAKEKKLPVLFIVEDNAYGISSPTREINPLALGVLEPNEWQEIAGGALTAEEFAKIDNEIKERIRSEYAEAEKAEDPSPKELEANAIGEWPKIDKEILPAGKYRIGDTVNKTLRLGLEEDPRRVIFGEDIEDPKGGVFRLTQKLSTEFAKQGFNSPLAESTILAVACSLAAYRR